MTTSDGTGWISSLVSLADSVQSASSELSSMISLEDCFSFLVSSLMRLSCVSMTQSQKEVSASLASSTIFSSQKRIFLLLSLISSLRVAIYWRRILFAFISCQLFSSLLSWSFSKLLRSLQSCSFYSYSVFTCSSKVYILNLYYSSPLKTCSIFFSRMTLSSSMNLSLFYASLSSFSLRCFSSISSFFSSLRVVIVCDRDSWLLLCSFLRLCMSSSLDWISYILLMSYPFLAYSSDISMLIYSSLALSYAQLLLIFSVISWILSPYSSLVCLTNSSMFLKSSLRLAFSSLSDSISSSLISISFKRSLREALRFHISAFISSQQTSFLSFSYRQLLNESRVLFFSSIIQKDFLHKSLSCIIISCVSPLIFYSALSGCFFCLWMQSSTSWTVLERRLIFSFSILQWCWSCGLVMIS